ncbi:MAG: hypothetical protein NPINA01_09960 [Nitrospinaceae bacterium]|nr:MAG: hypothetical protein NPINA01_09960 [Nitrospinaceae bacterium]
MFANPSYGQENKKEKTVEAIRLEKDQSALLQVAERMIAVRKELDALQIKPSTTETTNRIEGLQKELGDLHQSFETLATKLQEGEFPENEEAKLDWFKELQEITKPLLIAIRELTDKPRKIDSLKARIIFLKKQLARYEKAKDHLEALAVKNSIKDKELKRVYDTQLKKLAEKYNSELVRFRLEEAQRSLDQIQATEKSFFDFLTDSFGNFFKVRGRNFLVALFTFIGFWWGLNKTYNFLSHKTKILRTLNPQIRKLANAASNVFILAISLFAGLVSLYVQDDWLLLSIIIMTLFAVAWSSRQIIPQFLKELRLILDLGTVREGERLIWKGVPFLVKDIGIYTTLTNSQLAGGVIKMPVGELLGQHSRPVVKAEPWFPTKAGDWVILSDGTYGQVVTQTIEQVVLKHKGSMKHYPTSEFLTSHPVNLSTGYKVITQFGLDYGVQSRICDEIPQMFKDGLKKHLAQHFENDPPDFQEVHVHFSDAGASSLNLLIIVNVDGRCAENYYPFKWAISTTLVRICNENGLVIPFTQLTVSLADDVKSLAKTSLENQSAKRLLSEQP